MATPESATENSFHSDKEKRIPIRNLWLLILYASNLFKHMEQKKATSAEENPDKIPDLVAEILTLIVSRRLKRNLNASYQPRQEILKRVRGRIDLLKTERRQLLQKAQVACRFEELTIDTPRNRFVRDALDKLASLVTDKTLAHLCRLQALTLRRAGVIGIRPPRKQIIGERFARHDKDDRQMVFASLLAFDLALPSESGGKQQLFAPDFEKLWELYEKAVAGFYEVVLKRQGWDVHSQAIIKWQNQNRGEVNFLPAMKPDIIIDHKNAERRIIVDTKCSSILTHNQHGDEKFKRDHIFQIYAYLRSQEGLSSLADQAEGLLLYPAINKEVDEWTLIQKHIIRFKTVNLAVEATQIREQLLQAVKPPIS